MRCFPVENWRRQRPRSAWCCRHDDVRSGRYGMRIGRERPGDIEVAIGTNLWETACGIGMDVIVCDLAWGRQCRCCHQNACESSRRKRARLGGVLCCLGYSIPFPYQVRDKALLLLLCHIYGESPRLWPAEIRKGHFGWILKGRQGWR